MTQWWRRTASFLSSLRARGSSAAIKLLMAFRRWAEQRNVSELNINMSVAVEMSRFNKMMSKLGFRCCGSNFSLGLGGQSSDFLPTSIAREVT